jgi:hypothetical protein
MKKILLFGALVCSLNVFSQDYWTIKSTGTVAPYSMNDATGVAVLTGTTAGVNNTLSAPVSLPFSNWKFFGKPVSQFKISSSGYITFDLTQTADVVANTTLPNPAAPKNAIFAFWDNLNLQPVVQGTSTFPSDVKTFIYGSSPNRVFVVQWRLTGTVGTAVGTNVTYFAIRMYEAGNFDIVHNYGFGTFTASCGVQNDSATNGYMVAGSPSLNFGGANGSYDATKSSVYTFLPGPQPGYDAALTKLIAPQVTKANTNLTLSGIVSNYGKNDLTALKVYYSIDGAAKVAATLSNLNTTNSGGFETFDFPTPLNFTTGGNKVIKAWIDNPNLHPDENRSNDTLTTNIFVNDGISGTKRVLLEEGSGAWCGYCPDGHLRMRDILAANSKVVAVVHHNSDGMANTQSNTINTAYATGYPYGVVDRTLFADQITVGLNRGLWDGKATENLNAITPVNISIINKTYNAATRTLSYTVKADFVDNALPGDMRITSIISEDNVRGPMISGTSTTWNQHSYYSSADAGAGGATHELYNEPAYFYGYNHRHVAKTILPSAWGNAGVIPNAPLKGSSYTQDFTYTLPAVVSVSETDFPANTGIYTPFQNTYPGEANNKIGATKIIALLSYYNADATKRQVINVNETPALWGTSTKEEIKSAYFSNVFPNPTSGLTQIDFKLSSTDNLTIELFDIMGKSVKTIKNGSFASGEHSIFFDTENIQNGIYFIKLSSTNYTATHKLTIQK